MKNWEKMRMLFSQRNGYKPISTMIQRENMSEELRNSLWNVLDICVWKSKDFQEEEYGMMSKRMEKYTSILWGDYFKKPVDTRNNFSKNILKIIREYFFKCHWYEVYDFIQFSLPYLEDKTLSEVINPILERELSAYRIVGDIFTEVTDEQEINMLEESLNDNDFPGVQIHLKRALELFSDRDNPDYRNSIKESISAIESLTNIIVKKPKSSLGDALKILEKKGKFHPALLDAFIKLYGYTSDKGGIRHSMVEDPNIGQAEAKFFLISCTSFINYLKSKL